MNNQATSGGSRWSQFGNWMEGARDNLGARVNNAQEMRDTVQENGGNFAAGVAGATAGFFGGGGDGDSGSDKTDQDTTTSTTNTTNTGTGTTQDTTTSTAGGEATSRSTTSTSERTTRAQNMQGDAEGRSQSSGGVARYEKVRGEDVFVPQSTAGLPSHMDIGPITSDGFSPNRTGYRTDELLDNHENISPSYEEQGLPFVARDQESGQLYDLSEITGNQEPPERDYEQERREKQSARDVENAREETND